MQDIEKLSTGIPSLDHILNGGLPRHSINVIAGPPGAGKTILAQQIVFHNSKSTNAPYLLTVSEPTIKVLRYSQQFSFFKSERVGRTVTYLDIGSVLLEEGIAGATREIGRYIEEYRPSILAIDSFKAIHEMARDAPKLREFTYRLSVKLAAWETTTLLIGEYTREDISEAPAFAIADGIILLDSYSREMQTYRHLEIIKMRGDGYASGKHPFTIDRSGITVYPRLRTPTVESAYPVGQSRVSLGIPSLDEMMHGGALSATSTLVAGSAGTGKTLTCLHFLLEGIKRGEPGLLVTFQETPSMLDAFARGFGWDLRSLQASGKLHILYTSPVELGVDQHAYTIRQALAKTGAKRVVMDSLKDLELATPDKVRYKDYIYSLVNDFRRQGIASMLTSEIPEMFGTFVVSEFGISFVADNVILLRYVELGGRIARAVSVLKMRGSNHDKAVREYLITSDHGLEVQRQFVDYERVLTAPVVATELPGAEQLAPRARRVLRMLRDGKGMTVEAVAAATEDPECAVAEVLSMLCELGYVMRKTVGSQEVFSVTLS